MRRIRWAGIYVLCCIVTLVARVALSVTKYQRVRVWLVKPCDSDPQVTRVQTVGRVSSGIYSVARFLPDANCLTQCIAAQAILSWKGIPTTISIGVKKAGEGDIRAHAWLMWNDELALDSSHERVDFTKVLELPTEPLVVASATNS